MSTPLHRPPGSRGFTLLEILSAVAVLTLMLVLVNQLTLSGTIALGSTTRQQAEGASAEFLGIRALASGWAGVEARPRGAV